MRMQTSPAMTRGNAGYTLLELLVALAIIAMAVTAVPAIYEQVIPNYRVRQFANDFAYHLRSLREAARSEGIMKQINFDALPMQLAPNNGSIPEDTEIEFQPSSLWNSEGVRSLRFYPNGSSNGGEITVIRRNLRVKVVVDWVSGAIQVKQ